MNSCERMRDIPHTNTFFMANEDPPTAAVSCPITTSIISAGTYSSTISLGDSAFERAWFAFGIGVCPRGQRWTLRFRCFEANEAVFVECRVFMPDANLAHRVGESPSISSIETAGGSRLWINTIYTCTFTHPDQQPGIVLGVELGTKFRRKKNRHGIESFCKREQITFTNV